MSNRKMNLSGKGKELLDLLRDTLEVERAQAIKIALAKGIANADSMIQIGYHDSNKKWVIPDAIIRGDDYLLFKHLIINEQERSLSENEVNDFMLLYIEHGLRIIKLEMESLTSLEDYRLSILN